MLPASLTTVDLIAIIGISIGAMQGLFRGLSGETARLLGAICAFVAGALLHEPLGEWVATYTRLIEQEARIFTYIITVIAALILWALLHKLIKKLLQLILTPGFDKAAGIPAGMLRATALVGIGFIAINIWPNLPLQKHFGEQSFFGRQAIRCVPAVKRQMQEHNLSLPAQNTERQHAAPTQDHEEQPAP